jgi:glutathione peroxidase
MPVLADPLGYWQPLSGASVIDFPFARRACAICHSEALSFRSADMSSIYDFEARSIDGQPVSLQQFRGQPLLIVNTASACGFTPQFGGLEQLHQAYGPRGLVVLGFPCNQFGQQDPGSDEEIATFCQRNFGVTFPMMSKIDVNGPEAHPLYQWLSAEAPGLLGSKAIKWNFTKFLVGKDGRVLKRYAPQDAPEKLTKDIEAALL